MVNSSHGGSVAIVGSPHPFPGAQGEVVLLHGLGVYCRQESDSADVDQDTVEGEDMEKATARLRNDPGDCL